MRTYEISRETNETSIDLKINIDGSGKCTVDTGIGFFDHMINLFTRHSGLDIDLKCKGDLNIDNHHTVEDIGIVLGQGLKEAIIDKRGINRYGTFYCPMDEALSRASIDLSGRGYLVYQVDDLKSSAGDFETDMLKEFFYSFAINGGINLHITNLYGENTHHIIESIFKAFGRALKEACLIDIKNSTIPSTKGVL